MGSDESHFNVSLIMSDKVATRCPQTTIFLKRRDSRSGFEPRPFCLPVLLLGHSGSRFISVVPHICIYTTEVLFLPPPPSNMSSSGAAMLFRSLQMNSRKMLGSWRNWYFATHGGLVLDVTDTYSRPQKLRHSRSSFRVFQKTIFNKQDMGRRHKPVPQAHFGT